MVVIKASKEGGSTIVFSTSNNTPNVIRTKSLLPKIKLKTKDSDDEAEAPIEEHVILRVPPDSELKKKFQDMVKTRKLPADFNLVFKGMWWIFYMLSFSISIQHRD
jgi:hypothetical protein